MTTFLQPNISQQSIKSDAKIKIFGFKYVPTIVLGFVLGILFYYIFSVTHKHYYIFLILSICSPLPAGLLLGLKMKILHIKVFIIGGVIIGFMNYIGIQIIYSHFIINFRIDLLLIIGFYFFGGIAMCLSGGFIGSWLKKTEQKKRN
jgi:hypothetical protein